MVSSNQQTSHTPSAFKRTILLTLMETEGCIWAAYERQLIAPINFVLIYSIKSVIRAIIPESGDYVTTYTFVQILDRELVGCNSKFYHLAKTKNKEKCHNIGEYDVPTLWFIGITLIIPFLLYLERESCLRFVAAVYHRDFPCCIPSFRHYRSIRCFWLRYL